MDHVRFTNRNETYGRGHGPSYGIRVPVGTYVVPEDYIHRVQNYETAAWWREFLVAAGEYEVFTNGYYGFVRLTGTVTDGYFGTLYHGVAIGSGKGNPGIGQEMSHTLMPYLYEMARAFADPDSPYTPLPNVEPVVVGWTETNRPNYFHSNPQFGIVLHNEGDRK